MGKWWLIPYVITPFACRHGGALVHTLVTAIWYSLTTVCRITIDSSSESDSDITLLIVMVIVNGAKTDSVSKGYIMPSILCSECGFLDVRREYQPSAVAGGLWIASSIGNYRSDYTTPAFIQSASRTVWQQLVVVVVANAVLTVLAGRDNKAGWTASISNAAFQSIVV